MQRLFSSAGTAAGIKDVEGFIDLLSACNGYSLLRVLQFFDIGFTVALFCGYQSESLPLGSFSHFFNV
jgi:hypothetical protein